MNILSNIIKIILTVLILPFKIVLARYFSTPAKKRPRYTLQVAVVIIFLLGPIIFVSLRKPGRSETAWFDTNWGYRQKIPVNNDSGSTQTNFQVELTGANAIDTAAASTYPVIPEGPTLFSSLASYISRRVGPSDTINYR